MQAHLPKIIIDVVPHKKQRYDTCGDYYKKGGALQIRVSKMVADHEFLVMMHELIEWYLTNKRGITIESIDKFDVEYEKRRKDGDTSEPGDDEQAPYYKEHQFATNIEKQLAEELGVNWDKYDEHVNTL